QTETSCTPATAGAYTKTSSALTACGSTATGGTCAYGAASSSPLLWMETRSVLSTNPSSDPQGSLGDGDRETLTTYAVYADSASTYRVHALTTTKNSRSGSSTVMYAKTARTWDATFTVPLTDEVWFDTDDAHRAITRRVYDMTTGNVLERWKPVQNAAN